MRQSLFILLLLLTSWGAKAQLLKGIVTDATTGKPLQAVLITNAVTQQTATTDEQGYYAIAAHTGDGIYMDLLGYRLVKIEANASMDQKTALLPLSVDLKEFVFHNYDAYQKDSAELTTLYSKELNTKPIKVGFSSANGGGLTGLIGGPIQKMSKSYKQNKRFKETFKSDMEQKYIDTKYTTTLVTAMTHLEGDTLITFMNTYPMSYEFARAATDLELKMWVRTNYKDYVKKTAIAHVSQQ